MFAFYRERKDDFQLQLSRRKTVKDWWFDISTAFSISFELGLFEISFNIVILDSLKFKIDLKYPWYCINFPQKLNDLLSWDKHWFIGKHKALEIQMMPNSCIATAISIHRSIHTDHAGMFINIKFILFEFDISIYDGRHWNDEKHRWMTKQDYENQCQEGVE
jgi:hypothetical protein